MAIKKLQENRSLLGFESKAGSDGVGIGADAVNNKYNQDSATNNSIRTSLLMNRAAQEKYNQDTSEAANANQAILNDESKKGTPEYARAYDIVNAIKQAQGFYQDNELSLKHGIKGGAVTAGYDGKPVLTFGNGVRNTIDQAGLEAIRNNSAEVIQQDPRFPNDPSKTIKVRGRGTGQQLEDELNNRFFGYENGLNENYTSENVGDPNFVKRASGSGNTWMEEMGKPIMGYVSDMQGHPFSNYIAANGGNLYQYGTWNRYPNTPQGQRMATYGNQTTPYSLLQGNTSNIPATTIANQMSNYGTSMTPVSLLQQTVTNHPYVATYQPSQPATLMASPNKIPNGLPLRTTNIPYQLLNTGVTP